MIVTFYDRQNPRNSANGLKIANGKQLLALIESLRTRPPFFCELVGENGNNLLVGIGGDVGCTQYSSENGSPPYWMALCVGKDHGTEVVDFLMADTATPIPIRYCLPFDVMKKVIVYFQEAGYRSPAVDWEEI
jgi:hypothetical protein